ncbi:MAG: hypothetical protein H0Z33_10885 [Bacillaceae bacterium]|nr:hypothetical protein [Bacillaceae bacterium]
MNNEENSWWEIIIERFLSKILEPFQQLKPIEKLVFESSPDAVWGLFTLEEYEQVIIPGQNIVSFLSWTVLVVAIILAAQRLSLSRINPGARQDYFQLLGNWLIVTVLLYQVETIFDILFMINHAIVTLFYIESPGSFHDILFVNPETGAELNIIAQLIIQLVIFGLSIWLNFFYIMRKYVLIFLIILAPFFIVLFLFPQSRGVTGAWMKETVSNIAAQAVHAMMLWVYLSMGDAISANWLVYIVVLCLFIPFSETLRMLLGATGSTGQLATAGTMMGAGFLLHMGRTFQQSRQLGRDMVTSLRGDEEKQTSSSSSEARPTRHQHRNTQSEKRTAPVNRQRMQTASRITGSVTGLTAGAAGAIIGAAAMGREGIETGETVGRTFGEPAGQAVGRAAYAGGTVVSSYVIRKKQTQQDSHPQPAYDGLYREKVAERRLRKRRIRRNIR